MIGDLSSIRELGFSVDNEERNLGMRCIAAPIFNAFGEPVAGLSISGPSVRVSPDQDVRLGQLIRDAARDVTRAVGGRLP